MNANRNGRRDTIARRVRSLATCALLALAAGAGGCSFLGQNYVCSSPGPDRPDAEEPDRFPGSLADSVETNPCRPGPDGGQ